MCLLSIEAAGDGHRGDWLCLLDQEEEGAVKNIDAVDKTMENTEEVLKVQHVKIVFYILFFRLALLAKLLLLGVIVFSPFIAFCKG